MNNEIVKNKNLYKVFLTIVKYIPISTAIMQIILTILNYFGIFVPIITYVGGTSIIFIILLFIMSYLFKFCYLYRIPLWYITVIVVISLLRAMGLVPLDLIDFYRLYVIIFGLFTTLFVGYAYKNRNNPNNKIDYVKDLCERYCKCEN